MAADRGAAEGTRGPLGLLFLVSLFHFVDRSLVVIAVEPLRAEFALDDFALSLLTGAAYSVPYAVALIPLGLLADSADRARLITVLFALFSLATGLIGLAASLTALVVARMAVGASEAGVIPASLSLLSERYAPADRSRAFGVFFLASALGTIVSFGLGGAAIERFGWRAPFLGSAVAGLAIAGVLAARLRDRGRSARAADRAGWLGRVKPLFRQPRLVALWLAGAFATALLVGFWAWMASFFQRAFGLSIGEAGLLLAAGAGVLAGLGTYTAGVVHSRLRAGHPNLARALPALLALLSGLAVLAAVVSDRMPFAVGGFLCASLLLPMYLPIAFSIGSEAVGADASATHAAVQQFANNAAGAALGPALVGAVSAAAGSLRAGLLSLVCLAPLAALAFAVAVRSGGPVHRARPEDSAG